MCVRGTFGPFYKLTYKKQINQMNLKVREWRLTHPDTFSMKFKSTNKICRSIKKCTFLRIHTYSKLDEAIQPVDVIN